MYESNNAASSGNVVSFSNTKEDGPACYDLIPFGDASCELRYAIEKVRRKVPAEKDANGQLLPMDPLGSIALGGRSDGGDIDTSIYVWIEDEMGSRWQVQTMPELRADAQKWLRLNAPDEVSGSRPKSCIETMVDLLVGQGRYLHRDDSLSLVPLRNAYLIIENDGNLRAVAPDKSYCIDYVIQADLDWSRVDPKTGSYTPLAAAPDSYWHRYLTSTFVDKDTHDYTQEALSTVLLSRCYEKGVWLYGEGENGKSVMLHILRSLAPRHTQAIKMERLVKNQFGTASLNGKRLITVSEMPSRLTKSMQDTLKGLISWDPTPCEKKGKDEFSFVPRAFWLFATNHHPEVSNHEHGFWRKIETIPFTNRVNAEDKILDLHKLIAKDAGEMAQVVDWLLFGAQCLTRNGGWRKEEDKPASVRKLMQQQRRDSDTVAAWLYDVELHFDQKVLSNKQPIYQSYRMHTEDAGKHPISDVKFWQRMKEHFRADGFDHEGIQKTIGSGRPRCVNLRLEGIKPDFEVVGENHVSMNESVMRK